MDTIFTIGSQTLRAQSAPVKNIDGKMVKTIEAMFELMYKANGVGLAANQVGITESFSVIDVERDADKSRLVLINPMIVHAEGSVVEEEGCLSVPELYCKVKRHARLTVQALDINGKKYEIECEGLLARAVQHEIDHLQGILFVDRLSAVDKVFMKSKIKKLLALEQKERRF